MRFFLIGRLKIAVISNDGDRRTRCFFHPAVEPEVSTVGVGLLRNTQSLIGCKVCVIFNLEYLNKLSSVLVIKVNGADLCRFLVNRIEGNVSGYSGVAVNGNKVSVFVLVCPVIKNHAICRIACCLSGIGSNGRDSYSFIIEESVGHVASVLKLSVNRTGLLHPSNGIIVIFSSIGCGVGEHSGLSVLAHFTLAGAVLCNVLVPGLEGVFIGCVLIGRLTKLLKVRNGNLVSVMVCFGIGHIVAVTVFPDKVDGILDI